MSDSTVFGSDGDSPEDSPHRADFTKHPQQGGVQPVPEVNLTAATAVPAGMVRVETAGGSYLDFDFKAGADVAYYTRQASMKVGGGTQRLFTGRSASINGMQVPGKHKVRDQGVVIVVARRPHNG